MFSRISLLFLSLLILTVPASGLNIPQSTDSALIAAAARMKGKDYRGAGEAAQLAQPSGMRDFLLGMVAMHTEEWDKAAEHLDRAAIALPLLADYAFYNRALALQHLSRYPDSLAILQGFAKNYPESPLCRSSDKLRADILFDSGDFTSAATAYQAFIEQYSSGSDTLAALHRLALCREKTGDTAGAVSILRNIWLKYPASSLAAGTEEDLRRLAEHGAKIAPYSAEELLKRGIVLGDLRKYDKALKTFTAIPLAGEPDEFVWQVLLKTGQTQFRARHFREAEKSFSGLLARNPRSRVGDETRYWLAKTLDKLGRDEEAFRIYIRLADSSPASNLADDSLLAAAFIRKFQNKNDEQLALLKILVQKYPASNMLQIAFWEMAWTSYQNGDLKTAAYCFKKQLDNSENRDRALYWYGRTLAASGDTKGAAETFAALVKEFPLGFYAMSYEKEAGIIKHEPLSLPPDLCAVLPLPSGFERAKALISMGLNEEAGKELQPFKKKFIDKPAMLVGLARLYLEMGDFHAAFSLYRDGRLRYPDSTTLAEWGISYPLAFREEVAVNAAKSGIPEGLVYAVMRAESNYFPAALSPAGAVGLMQVMPATAAAVAKGGGEECSIERLTLTGLNIRLGIKHLKDLLMLYNGDQILAVAAYNAGSGNVNRWLKTFGKMPRDRFIENIPFPETREYVKKVLASAEVYRRLYGLGGQYVPTGGTIQRRYSS